MKSIKLLSRHIDGVYKIVGLLNIDALCLSLIPILFNTVLMDLLNALDTNESIQWVSITLCLTALVLLTFLVWPFFRRKSSKMVHSAIRKLKEKIYTMTLCGKGVSNSNPLSIVTVNLYQVEDFLTKNGRSVITSEVQALAISVVLFFIDTVLAVVSSTLTFVMFVAAYFLQKKITNTQQGLLEERNKLTELFIPIQNNRDIFHFFPVAERYILNHYIPSAKLLKSLKQNLGKQYAKFSTIIWLTNGLRLSIIVIYGLLYAELPIGSLVALCSLTSFLSGSLVDLSDLLRSLPAAALSISEIDAYLTQPIESSSLSQYIPDASEGSLVVEDLNFSYGEKRLLNNANMTVSRGEVVGIVGDIGSGKSTLLKLILGVKAGASGKININGIEQTEENKVNLREQISYVDQNNTLFPGSIIDNITGFADVVDSQKLTDCIRLSGLTEDIESMSDGMQTYLDDYNMLSGGQAQRVCIARALYRNSPIIIFDEPTAALDVGLEQKFLTTLANIKQDKAIVIVSHRQSTVSIADRIYRIANMRLEELNNEK